ncbi:MAG: hypothetical protein HY758_03210 [Nitrospirae bacterium]|nr:hypothetical protein [Nitrospirota bacterium]
MKEQDTGYRIQGAGSVRRNGALKKRVSCIMHHASRPLNEKGFALVMVLIMSAISLAIMAGLIYMVVSGTQMSGVQKRYKTSLDAGKAGKDILYQFIQEKGDPGISGLTISQTISNDCMEQKLNNDTIDWSACSGDNLTLSIDPDSAQSYDFSFDIGASPVYTVYAKIADTIEGNSAPDLGLTDGGVVKSNSGEVEVMNIPYLYTIELEAEDASLDSPERAKLSVLYQY